MKRNILSQCLAAAALAATLAPGMAQAAVACTDSIRTDDLGLNPSYVSCTGSFVGNLPEVTITYDGADYAYIGKTENSDITGAGPFGAYGTDFKSGTLTFDEAWTGSFIVGLKAGNDYSLYKFESALPVYAIAFDTLGVSVNRNGIGNGLSHVALYGGEPVPAIPEPGTYALMLAGLGAISFVARRRGIKR